MSFFLPIALQPDVGLGILHYSFSSYPVIGFSRPICPTSTLFFILTPENIKILVSVVGITSIRITLAYNRSGFNSRLMLKNHFLFIVFEIVSILSFPYVETLSCQSVTTPLVSGPNNFWVYECRARKLIGLRIILN